MSSAVTTSNVRQQLDDLDALLKRLLDLPLGDTSTQPLTSQRNEEDDSLAPWMDKSLDEEFMEPVSSMPSNPEHTESLPFPRFIEKPISVKQLDDTQARAEPKSDPPLFRFPGMTVPEEKVELTKSEAEEPKPTPMPTVMEQSAILPTLRGPQIELTDRSKTSCEAYLADHFPIWMWPFWMIDKLFDYTLGFLVPFLCHPTVKLVLAFLGVGLGAVGARMWLKKLGW